MLCPLTRTMRTRKYHWHNKFLSELGHVILHLRRRRLFFSGYAVFRSAEERKKKIAADKLENMT